MTLIIQTYQRADRAVRTGDGATITLIAQTCQHADAFLVGRRTYLIIAPYRGVMDPGTSSNADALNTTPMYLTLTTVTERAGPGKPFLPVISRLSPVISRLSPVISRPQSVR